MTKQKEKAREKRRELIQCYRYLVMTLMTACCIAMCVLHTVCTERFKIPSNKWHISCITRIDCHACMCCLACACVCNYALIFVALVRSPSLSFYLPPSLCRTVITSYFWSEILSLGGSSVSISALNALKSSEILLEFSL